MNSIEEKLWNYIDGTCTAEEREQLSRLIIHDEEYKRQYEELMQLHTEFGTMELDEPPMAFTYNVMEQIRVQEANVPLKAAINKNIIRVIAGFFILSIAAIVIFTLSHVNWSAGQTSFQMPAKLQGPELASYFKGPLMKCFLFFDVVLGLFILDTYLRKRTLSQKHDAQ